MLADPASESDGSALTAFLERLDRLVRAAPSSQVDHDSLVAAIAPHLAALLRQRGWLDASRRRVGPEQRPAVYLLAAAPDDAWTVFSVVLPAGHSTPVHDHLTWGLVGVYDGVEEETRFERLDAGEERGFARLRAVDTVVHQPGQVTSIVPPREIHAVRNPLDVDACSIHVYGRDIDRIMRHSFDLDTGQVFEFSSAALTIR